MLWSTVRIVFVQGIINSTELKQKLALHLMASARTLQCNSILKQNLSARQTAFCAISSSSDETFQLVVFRIHFQHKTEEGAGFYMLLHVRRMWEGGRGWKNLYRLLLWGGGGQTHSYVMFSKAIFILEIARSSGLAEIIFHLRPVINV